MKLFKDNIEKKKKNKDNIGVFGFSVFFFFFFYNSEIPFNTIIRSY